MFDIQNLSSEFTNQEIGHIIPDDNNNLPSTQNHYFELNVIQNGIIFPFLMKKCCKKFKKGKRCKKCPSQ